MVLGHFAKLQATQHSRENEQMSKHLRDRLASLQDWLKELT